jgi:hypothetical protein
MKGCFLYSGNTRAALNLALPLLFLLCSLSASLAQTTDAMRVEIPSRSLNKNHHVEMLGSDGVMLFFESNELTDQGERKWYFSLYSTKLEERWIRYVLLKDGLIFDKAIRSGDNLYMLFSAKDPKKSQQPAFQMIIYKLAGEQFNLLGAPLKAGAEIKAFEIIHHHALIFVQDGTGIELITVNLSNAQVTVKSSGIEGQAVIQTSMVNHKAGEVILAVKKYISGRYVMEEFVTFNQYGQKRNQFQYLTDRPEFLHTYLIHPSDDGIYIVTGCYEQIDKKRTRLKDEQNETLNETHGFFFLAFTSAGLVTENFVELKNLDNLHSSLTSAELMQSRKRKSKSSRNERRVSMSFQFFNPALIKTQEHYVLSVEAFRPRYRTETRMDYDFYGRPIPYTYNVFDGFEFFAGVVNGFDSRGQLVWHNDIEMRDLISFDMNGHFNAFSDPDGMLLSYIGFGKIVSKMINQSKTIGQSELLKMESKHASDRLQAEDNANLKHWYDRYYLATGYQKIINNRLRDDATRTVFYMNKIMLE